MTHPLLPLLALSTLIACSTPSNVNPPSPAQSVSWNETFLINSADPAVLWTPATERQLTAVDPARRPASYGAFRPGMKRIKKVCSVYEEAGATSQVLNSVHRGQRLWTENFNLYWVRVYRRSGPAFVPKDCF